MEARDQLGLDLVRLVPVAIPPHKEIAVDPGVDVRVDLCELAAASEPGLQVSRIEADRPGPSFTVDTLRALHDAQSGDDLTFIVGGDQAVGLPQWREPETVLALARLAVVGRSGVERQQVLDALGSLDTSRVTFFDMPRLDVSSTLVRRRVAEGRPIRHLVPTAVAERIASLELYRSAVTA
jgi:nicotinate-nucleotide adenylyltransferase